MDANDCFAIYCPQCGENNWRCWDEWYEDFEDEHGEVSSLPVGGLVCRECDHAWYDYNWTDDEGKPLTRLGIPDGEGGYR